MSLLLTSFLISAIAALWVWMAGRKDPQGRPWLTALCMGMLLVLPLLTMLPKFHWALLGSVSGGAAIERQGSVWSGVMVVWLLGAGVMLFRFFYSQWVLVKWLEASDEIVDRAWAACFGKCGDLLGMETLPSIRVKKELCSPVVAGVFNPVVLIPSAAADWPENTLKMAVLHELGHVQRKDLWLRFAAEVTCALHWYNPLVWWMRATLLTQCEYACDARVIKSGVPPGKYISALCDVVESALLSQRSLPGGVCAMADHAPLKSRVERLLRRQPSGAPWLAVIAAVLTVATALGLTLVRPTVVQAGDRHDNAAGGSRAYSQEEIDLRHSADPFPGG